MELVERIRYYEDIFANALEKVRNLEHAMDEYEAYLSKINELRDYYRSDTWRQDYQADEDGLVPQDLPRGILSEDGIFNFLIENQEVASRIKIGDHTGAEAGRKGDT